MSEVKPSMENHLIQQANRVLVVSLASSDEIYQTFKNQLNQREQEKIPILRFYLGLKGNNGDQRYTLLGGKIDSLENPSEALVREMVEEAGVFTLGLPHHTKIGRWQYTIPGRNETREVVLTYQPVLPQEEIAIGDQKIQSVVAMSLEQLKELIEKGELDEIPIEGHLTLSPQEDISISQEDFDKQKKALRKGLSWMEHIENWLQKKFKDIFTENPNLTDEQFEKEYQKILSRFMRRGIETALRYKKAKETIPQETYLLLSALNEGYLGRDILYFLPQLAKHGLEWSGLDETTEGVKIFIDFIKSVFDSFEGKEQLLSTITDSNTLLNEKHHMLIQFNDHFKTTLSEIFGLTNDHLNYALELAQNFYRELLVDIRESDYGFRGVYQDYMLINEVNNAHYGYLLMLFLGYDTKNNNPEQMKKIRFEAGRQLLILLKTLSIYHCYHEAIRETRNGLAQPLINNLGSLSEEELLELRPGETIRIRKRKLLIPGFEDCEVIVDEKPNKSFSSFLRKSFFENPEKLVDLTSVNIVFDFKNNPQHPEDLLWLLDLPLETKITILNQLGISPNDERYQNCIKREGIVTSIIKWIKEQFPHCKIQIVDRKDYGIENFVCQKQDDFFNGYRAGSQSNRFLRTKIILLLNGKPLELVIYPIRTTKKISSYHWGWEEKIKDDKDYNQRRLFASENGFPSFYDLLFPPEIYRGHYKQKTRSRYHQ